MKPIVYFDFEDIGDEKVSVDKKRLKEILDEVYQAGYDDGKNSNGVHWTPPVPSNPVTPNMPWEITAKSPINLEKPTYKPNITCEYTKAAQLQENI